MSIASAISAAQQRVSAAYDAARDMGATIPQTQDLAHLPDSIRSIEAISPVLRDFKYGYIGFQPSSGGSPDIYRVALSPPMRVIAGHSITMASGLPRSINNALCHTVYVEGDMDNAVSYYNANPPTRTVSSFAKVGEVQFLRLLVNLDNLADTYVLDNTTGIYLFRGSDYASAD